MSEEKLTDEVSVEESKEKELKVSKVVLKTGLLTALIFLLVLIFAFTITAFVSPKLVSDISFKIGAKNISARFAVAQYERTKDINDLATAVERSISSKNHKSIVKYSEVLIKFKNKSGNEVFRDFAGFKDKILNSYYEENGIDAVSDYYNFIYGNYVYSLYKVNEKEKAYEIAFEQINDYVINNTISKYIDAYVKDAKRSATDLYVKLEEMFNELKGDFDYSDPEKAENIYGRNICIDLIKLYKALKMDDKVIEWEEEYENIP